MLAPSLWQRAFRILFPPPRHLRRSFPLPLFPSPLGGGRRPGREAAIPGERGRRGGRKRFPPPSPISPTSSTTFPLQGDAAAQLPVRTRKQGKGGPTPKRGPGINFFERVLTARRNWPSEIRGHSPVLWVPGRPGIPISGANSPECAGYWPMNWRCPRMARPPSVRPLEISLAFSLLFSLPL